jgi:hypothetical protein
MVKRQDFMYATSRRLVNIYRRFEDAYFLNLWSEAVQESCRLKGSHLLLNTLKMRLKKKNSSFVCKSQCLSVVATLLLPLFYNFVSLINTFFIFNEKLLIMQTIS